MALAETDLELRARRAYERGRLRSALGKGAVVMTVAGLGLLHCTRLGPTIGCIAFLTVVVVVFLHVGRGLARGARVGLAAGLVPFLAPIVVQALGVYCASPVLCLSVLPICFVGGAVGGLVLGYMGARPPIDARTFWVGAITVTLAAGSVGCLLAGAAGLAGLAVGLLLGTFPVLLARMA